MEPYRPFVDRLVLEIVEQENDLSELTTKLKAKLLGIPVIDVYFDKQKSPLLIGMSKTTASLASCFQKESRAIAFPSLYAD
jgi:CRISP-associated protein Cas1